LVEKGLTSMMVLHNFLSKRIAPLQDHARPVWLYTSLKNTTCLERSGRSDHESDVLVVTLSTISTSQPDRWGTHPVVCISLG
jgi:hypothetical protein